MFLFAPLLCLLLLLHDAQSTQTPRYIRSPETQHLDCAGFFPPKREFPSLLNGRLAESRKQRVRWEDPKNWEDLPMDCASIHNRTYFQLEDLYEEEREFPIAIVRVLFKDYLLVEKELGATYAPQNYYCYVMDRKSPEVFHRRVRALASCFPNVMVVKKEFDMDSHGKNMGYAHRRCMRALAKPEFKWKYMVLLQNHEVALKTNQEMIQIFKWYNGTNDVNAFKTGPEKILTKRYNWSFEALNLFKNDTRNHVAPKGYKPVIRVTKAPTQVSLSRAMVDFTFKELNLTVLMKRFEQSADLFVSRRCGLDELLMGTLNSGDAVAAPGGYTHHCIDKGIETHGLTVFVIWKGPKQVCKSKTYRHSVCMLGMEQLKDLSTLPHLFANKFLPAWDYGSVACWHEWMFNKTHLDRGLHRLNSDVYLNLKQVRFNRERQEKGDAFNAAKFNCSN